MKAFIYFNLKNKNKNYSGEGPYVLVTENDEVIGKHCCSSRGFANHDLTVWKLDALHKYNITEVYSNGELIWQNDELSKEAEQGFISANAEYERKYCNGI